MRPAQEQDAGSSGEATGLGGFSLLLDCVREQRWALGVAIVLIAIHGVALCLQNISPKWLFTYVLQPTGLSPGERLVRLVWFAALYLVTTVIFRMAAWHFSFRFAVRVREHVVARLRMRLLRAAARGCARFHQTYPSGQLQDYITGSTIQHVSQFLQHCTITLPAGLVNVAATFIFFFHWDWVTALTMFACGALSVASTVYFSRGLQTGDVLHQAREAEASASIGDFLRGARILPFHAGGNLYSEEMCRQARAIAQGASERELAAHREYMRHEMLGYGFYLVLLTVCTVRYFSGAIDLAVVAACLTAYIGLTWPLYSVISTVIVWPKASAALQAIDRVLAHPSSVPEPPAALRQWPGPSLDLALDRVSFAYPGASRRILDEVSLTVSFGERIGVMGRSGGGKSTLAGLLLRAYDPVDGVVTLGGVDLRRIPLATLQDRVAVVPQESHFFRCSLRTNLCIGNPDATDAELAAACAAACATGIVARLPAGFDTLLGDGGHALAGGERQRFAIARALLADPDLLVLDEATSALDAANELAVLEQLFQSGRRRTIICITHRLSTAAFCDRVILLADGAVRQDHTVALHAGPPGAARSDPTAVRRSALEHALLPQLLELGEADPIALS